MDAVISHVLAECVRAVEAVVKISRVSTTDKEFSFQNWFGDRLRAISLNFDGRASGPRMEMVSPSHWLQAAAASAWMRRSV